MHWPTAKRALVIVAVSTLVGCSAHALPPTAPGTQDNPVRVMATSSALPLVVEAVAAYPDASFTLEVRSGDYRRGLVALRRGDAHLMVTTHLAMADARALWAAPIARDAVALVTHPQTSVHGLSIEQLRAAFQGQVTNWADLGGPSLPLTVISREDGAGIRAEFEQTVMGLRRTTGSALTAASTEGVLRLVRETPGALGYVSLAAVDTSVRVLAVEGVLPTLETVADQSYPLRSTVFVVASAEPEGAARAFIGWLQSPDGQAVLMRRYRPVLNTPVP